MPQRGRYSYFAIETHIYGSGKNDGKVKSGKRVDTCTPAYASNFSMDVRLGSAHSLICGPRLALIIALSPNYSPTNL